ncbi:hypothetical protein [Sphingobium xenophagum]|uniref:hypothetical protein n=1 Tax=Sphingobium xenophagum TaxID=121428 RepID=UPI0020CBDC1B|nr:hypothetical protein [Sphingobium xenophagum]
MEMLDQLEIAAPAREGQISRSDEQMSIVLAEKCADLRVENAVIGAGNGFDFIVAADPARPFLAQTGTHALRIGQNKSIAPAATQQSVEKHRLEEG